MFACGRFFVYEAFKRKGYKNILAVQKKRFFRVAKVCTISTGFAVRIISGWEPESHDHTQDPKVVEALKQRANFKRAAVEYPERPPMRILRTVQDLPSLVLAKLPDRINLLKQLQRECLKEIPSTLESFADLIKISDKYTKTVVGGKTFILWFFCWWAIQFILRKNNIIYYN